VKKVGFCLAGQNEKSRIFYPSISDQCSSPLHSLCTTLAKFGHIFFDTYIYILSSSAPQMAESEDEALCRDVLLNHINAVYKPSTDEVHRINIRRTNLFEDTMRQFKKTNMDFSKVVEVRFCGEPAVDAGAQEENYFACFLRSCVTRPIIYFN